MKALFSLLLTVAPAIGFAQQATATLPPPTEYNVIFSESDFETKPWMKEFQYVIVVNKANKGADKQSIRIYKDQQLVTADDIRSNLQQMQYQDNNADFERSPLGPIDVNFAWSGRDGRYDWNSSNRGGRSNRDTWSWDDQEDDQYDNGPGAEISYDEHADVSWGLSDLKNRIWSAGNVFKVSTGREEFEQKGQHGSQKDNYTITPAGYFVPQYFTPHHKSDSYSSKTCSETGGYGYVEEVRQGWFGPQTVQVWKELPKCVYMDDVTFFNGGIALHRAITGTEPDLGNRASGGCTRLPGAVAKYLYVNLQAAKGKPVPQIKQDGSVVLDKNGQIVRETKHKSEWGTLDARSALIIVQNKYVEPPPAPKPAPKPAPAPTKPAPAKPK